MAKRITNYENNKEIVDRYAVAQVQWGIDTVSGEITPCSKILACASLCEFAKGEDCGLKRMEWLSDEYIDIDWSKVDVDTLILVSNDRIVWSHRYFAGEFFGRLYTFPFDHKSNDNKQMNLIEWKFGKLIEEEEEDDWD